MLRTFGLGLAVVLMSASAAMADPTCPSGTWTNLTNGSPADAGPVMTNFNCLAPLDQPAFMNRVGIGAAPNLAVGGNTFSLQINSTGITSNTPGAAALSWGNQPSYGGIFLMAHSRGGNIGSQVASVLGDTLGSILFAGSDGTAMQISGLIESEAEGTWTTTSRPTSINFRTTPSGSTSAPLRMKITSSGQVGIGTATPGARLSLGSSSSGTRTFYTYEDGNFVRGFGNDLGSLGGYETNIYGSDSGSGVGGISLGKMSTNGAFTYTPLMVIRNDGKVGIGTSSPVGNLDVYGSGNTNGLRLNGATSGNGPVIAARGNDTNITLTLQSLGTGAITLMTGGGAQVKVGNTASAENWMVLTGGVAGSPGVVSISAAGVSSNISIGLSPKGTGYVSLNGQVLLNSLGSATATNLCINSTLISSCSSSIRYKEHIKSASFGLKEVLAMRPVTFKWKGRDENDLGFIAEEVAKINPLFATYKDGRIEGVKYPQMTAVLTKAIQEQQKAIDQLRAANDNQASEIQQQAREIDALRTKQAAEVQELRSAIAELKQAAKLRTAQR